MSRTNVAVALMCLGAATVIVISLARDPAAPSKVGQPIQGRVVGPDGPIHGAIVRYQATAIETATDDNGEFELPGADNDARITAAHPEFIVNSIAAAAKPPVIRLRPIPADNPTYDWQDPRPSQAAESHACANCHESLFAEWRESGHANSAVNFRFRNLHEGRRSDGRPGGWSLLADHPDGSGVCFACHAPTAAEDAIHSGDLSKLSDVAAQGVHCDFCHKAKDVHVDELGLTHGRDAFTLVRPPPGEQLFFGPLDDVDRDEDVFSPLQKQSQFCAACHEGTVFGMPVYTTYSEWLESKASRDGKSCQSCHMPSNGERSHVAKGGLQRDPATLSTHRMLPGGKLAMLRSAVQVTATLDDALEVQLKAQNVGHATPTGYIDRHLILVVTGAANQSLADRIDEGPRLDALAGASLDGNTGRLFARVVRDPDGKAPTPFWKSFDDPKDMRLPPDSTTKVRWTFQPEQAPDKVRVRLIYRRFWETVRVEKGWPDETLVVFDKTFERR